MSARPLLARRRSSQTAPNPGGGVVLSNPESSSSTITIFRPFDLQTQQQHQGHSRSHRKQGSNSSIGDGGPPSPRLSFANASFGRPATPPSPTLSTSSKRSLVHTRPSPDQLIALAKPTRNNPASSPFATFTPLPDNIILPFLNRPQEVATLISSPPTSKLFHLLAKTLPVTCSTPDDPTKWSITDLTHYLTVLDRDTDPDDVWVARIRSAVLPHSELIWERLKGALGVPPELDPGYEPLTRPRIQFDCNQLEESNSDVFLDSPVIEPQRPHSRASSIGSIRSGRMEPEFALNPPTPDAELMISPILPSTIPTTPVHSPLSDSTGHLQDISEEAETEEDAPEADPDCYTPAQIQGIKIAARRMSQSDVAQDQPRSISHFMNSSMSSLPSPPAHTLSPPKHTGHSPRVVPGRRSGSFGYESRQRAPSPLGSGLRPSSSTPRMADSRAPLFPSNFARLSPSN